MRRVLIVGRARGALDEYRAAQALADFDAVVVVGKMGEVFPDPIDYWVSFHANLFDRWAAKRAARGLPPACNFWGATYRGRPLDNTECAPLTCIPSTGGSSGFLAVEGALGLLAPSHVVLAGIPMVAEAGHEPDTCEESERQAPWAEAAVYWATWEAAAPTLGRVRSMSGRTRALLGAPTREWLEDGDARQ